MGPVTCVIAIFVLLCSCSCHGFFIPARRYRSYLQGEEVHALVSPMATLANMLPMDYYALPFCKPPHGVGSLARSLGEMLVSDGTQNSPYRFRINANESLYLCTTDPLTAQDLRLLFDRKLFHYIVHMVLDGLPLTSLDLDYSFKMMRGFFFSHMKILPVDWIYIINHLKFRISLHKSDHQSKDVDTTGEGDPSSFMSSTTRYEIVGFEVVPCSVARNSGEMLKLSKYDRIDPADCQWNIGKSMKARPGDRVTFTYEVEYVMSNISWGSRWDQYYLKVKGPHARLFSVLRSAVFILILVIIFFVKFSRSILRELTMYSAFNSEGRFQLHEGIPGWKLIAGDVLRTPNYSRLLCVVVGTGAQIILVSFVCIVLGSLGFIYPAPRGTLLTWILLFYLFFGVIAGYVGVWLWGNITGSYKGWRSVCYSIVAFFPGVIFFITGLLNLVYWVNGSIISTTPTSYCLLALWACILLLLTHFGGILATNHEPMQSPVETNVAPRKIPTSQLRLCILIFVAGYIPFSVILDELFLIFHCICYGWYYNLSYFLLVAILLLAVACSLCSVVMTYNIVYAGNWRWWWKSLLASGFAGIYVFFFAIKYLVFNLPGFVSGAPSSITIYLGYSMVVALAVVLSTGAIGFLASFCFIRFLYAFSKF